MTKQPHPHRLRVLNIKGAFLLIALAAALCVWLSSCSPQYGYPAVTKNKLQGYTWVKCK